MVNLSPVALVLIVVACAVVALLVGYFLGSRFGGKKSVAMREALPGSPRNVGVLLSGGNVDPSLVARLLQEHPHA